mmetsp:Transcript_10721/g.24882  ORF Transcript_10721/g.24882 Transcript_10721/m.24882 type:complete len:259 (+) Transcript_10721:406-1182(+)
MRHRRRLPGRGRHCEHLHRRADRLPTRHDARGAPPPLEPLKQRARLYDRPWRRRLLQVPRRARAHRKRARARHHADARPEAIRQAAAAHRHLSGSDNGGGAWRSRGGLPRRIRTRRELFCKGGGPGGRCGGERPLHVPRPPLSARADAATAAARAGTRRRRTRVERHRRQLSGPRRCAAPLQGTLDGHSRRARLGWLRGAAPRLLARSSSRPRLCSSSRRRAAGGVGARGGGRRCGGRSGAQRLSFGRVALAGVVAAR